mmetsp:Transcript_5294/g.11183  ORF Transcript_5294/g.11183 Transcript_5294/m.11183 type:complete len:252 (+) Transcript_5294:2657-3412(+)
MLVTMAGHCSSSLLIALPFVFFLPDDRFRRRKKPAFVFLSLTASGTSFSSTPLSTLLVGSCGTSSSSSFSSSFEAFTFSLTIVSTFGAAITSCLNSLGAAPNIAKAAVVSGLVSSSSSSSSSLRGGGKGISSIILLIISLGFTGNNLKNNGVPGSINVFDTEEDSEESRFHRRLVGFVFVFVLMVLFLTMRKLSSDNETYSSFPKSTIASPQPASIVSDDSSVSSLAESWCSTDVVAFSSSVLPSSTYMSS